MVTDYALGVLNFLSKVGRVIGTENGFGTWKEIYRRETLDKYSPEQQAKLLEIYNESLGLDAGRMKVSAESFDTYIEGRKKTPMEAFGEVLGPDGEKFTKALKGDSTEAEYIRNALMGTLALTGDTLGAQKRFALDVQVVQALLNDPKAKYNAAALIPIMHEKRSAACNAIKEQQAVEIRNLNEQFSNPDFTAHLQHVLGTQYDHDYQQVTQRLLANLEKAHADELKKFDAAVTESIKELHAAAQSQRDRVAFLATLYENNQAMREQIDRMAEQYNAQNNTIDTLVVDFQFNAEGDKFKNVRIDSFTTLSGQNISDKDGKYTIHFPNHYLNPVYYNSTHNNPKADMLCLIQATKARGIKNIQVNLTHPKQERALEVARLAYESCRESGYAVDNIVINLNGKAYNGKEAREMFFQEDGGRYETTESRAKLYEERRDESFKASQNNIPAQVALKAKLKAIEDNMEQEPVAAGAHQVAAGSP